MSPEVSRKKVSQIDSYLNILQDIASKERHSVTEVESYAAERMMQLLVDTAADLLAHILKDKFKVKTRSYSEVFEESDKNGLIEPKLSRQMISLSSFRNMLVHQYGDITREDVVDRIEDFIFIFTEFVHQVREKI